MTSRPSRAEEAAVRVVIADDHPVVREGLRAMLKAPGVTVVGEARNGAEVVERVREVKPDVVLMDVKMPTMDGIAATQAIKEESAGTSVIMITSFETKDYLRRAIAAGAAGYLIKGASRETLIQAVKMVRQGGSLVDAELLSGLFDDDRVAGSDEEAANDGLLASLTTRELEVLRLLAAGLTNKEIATKVHYSVGTVKNVVQRIIEKLHVSDRTQAAVMAVRAGLEIAIE